MSWLARSFVVSVPRRAWCEMTAEAIASSRAMIDFHGRVLRLTRSTCVDRSICLPFCTVLILSRPVRAPNRIRRRAALADYPGQRKALGNRCSPALLRKSRLANQCQLIRASRPVLADKRSAGRETDHPSRAVLDSGRRRVPSDERGNQADLTADLDRPRGDYCRNCVE